MALTSIEWTDETWNPTRGCSRVSEGCRNCYAERVAARFSRDIDEIPGPRIGQKSDPFAGYAIFTDSGPRWTGKVELIESKLYEPEHWKKPRRVFVNSMSDLWHEKLGWLIDMARVYGVMYKADWHTYQILTKRAGNRLSAFQDSYFWEAVSHYAGKQCKPGANHIWEGVSVENQETADERIPLLLQTPAALRFVSYEPALGPVVFDADWLWPKCKYCGRHGKRNTPQCDFQDCGFDFDGSEHRLLDQIIIGGESGPGARPFDLDWAIRPIEQCQAAHVAAFLKQLGSRPGYQRNDGWHDLILKDRKGADMSEWPKDIPRIREFPR